MDNILISIVSVINELNEKLFSPADNFIDNLPYISNFDWVADALKDSVHMLPFLFLIFVAIEITEYFFINKIKNLSKYSQNTGPLAGSLAASFPQCGFSVIASTLYTKRLITKGTLLAVYLSTSDEAIPVILSEPSKIGYVVPLLLTKILIAILAGYFIDFVLDKQDITCKNSTNEIEHDEHPHGCCNHDVSKPRKRDLLYHPLQHTFNVFIFILLVTLGINYLILIAGGEDNLSRLMLGNSVFQPIITALLGLIPNCSVSVALTLLYLKGALSFGSVISGLCSGAGLGLLVLIKKNNDVKDTTKIILLLLTISIFFGILLQFAIR